MKSSAALSQSPSDLSYGGIIAIIRAPRGVDLPSAVRALARGGVRAIEITLNTPGALAAIEQALRETSDGEWIGAGTAIRAEDVAAAVGAGAQFIVTPTLSIDAIEACRRLAVPIVCGCSTPMEMFDAHRAGADLIKLFPATRFGPGYVRSVLEVMPSLRLVPTGGVAASNVAEYFAAGVAAVAVGSQLVSPRALAEGRWDEMSAAAAELVAAVSRARAGE